LTLSKSDGDLVKLSDQPTTDDRRTRANPHRADWQNRRSMSTHSQGHGTATAAAQLIAEQLGVPYEDVTVYKGDSARGGFSPGAAAAARG
jgi:hypothetical protein